MGGGVGDLVSKAIRPQSGPILVIFITSLVTLLAESFGPLSLGRFGLRDEHSKVLGA